MSNVRLPGVMLSTSMVFLCVFLSAHFVTMTSMVFVRSSTSCCAISILILLVWMLFGGGLLRSLATTPFDGPANMFCVNPIRYANFVLALKISSELPIYSCVRKEGNEIESTAVEKFCRWTNSTKYFEEAYPSSVQSLDYWINMLILAGIVFVLLLVTLAIHAIPQSRLVVDKFRFTN
ncbi:unnamed protein product [Angiostrongylus costaricensis]|uniref:Neur_chan_memb domain-containing protein n=1 Tax=Angiostrongylus costaricensis TaxID=334426 RepID=A0A0R3PC75_ANGCS|nr:unnamed protein product [Angiostrongylus costaricensis]